MCAAVIGWPCWVPVATGTSWTRKLLPSVKYRLPALSVRTLYGRLSSAAVAAPPSPEDPLAPVALPATVYISLAVTEIPNWVPDAAGTSWIRLLPWSAMNRLPAASSARPQGWFSSAEVAGPPSPEDPLAPDELPATM